MLLGLSVDALDGRQVLPTAAFSLRICDRANVIVRVTNPRIPRGGEHRDHLHDRLAVYDTQTRSLLQTDQRFPSVSSQKKEHFVNPDTSLDVYFGPEPSVGKESNWIQTLPGKGWWTYLRLYGPLEPWFDQTWRPGEIELLH